MRIAFLTLSYPLDESDRNLYTDLMDELSARGNEVTVYRPDETRRLGPCEKTHRLSVRIVSIPTGRVTKAPMFPKAVNTALLGRRYLRAVLADWPDDLDLVLYSTPPISFTQSVRKLKKRTGCVAYLMLKDIFPQNAVDLGLLRKANPVYWLLRLKEKALYRVSDHIGCMSPANVRYLEAHNTEIPGAKIHLCPNSIRPDENPVPRAKDVALLRGLGIPSGRFLLVYGGNLGKPQGIDFIADALKAIDGQDDVFTVIMGNGTEYGRLKGLLAEAGLRNAKLMPALPKDEYLRLLSSSDSGLVFLDRRFSVPNFPSRLLDYLNAGLPVIACTDTVCDIKEEICEAGAGIWCESGRTDSFASAVSRMKNDARLRDSMSAAAFSLLAAKYSSSIVADGVLSDVSSASAGQTRVPR